MNTILEIESILKKGSFEELGRIVKDQIDLNLEAPEALRLYNIYAGSVDIKNRKFDDQNKVNNKLSNDYAGDIVDQVVGYLFGKPVTYGVNKEKYPEAAYKAIMDELDRFKSRNAIEDLDSTAGEYCAACGFSFRLCYIDKEGKERVMNIKPWEALVIKDASIDETQYGLIYYNVDVEEDGATVARVKAEWYDKENIYFFQSTDGGDFIKDPDELQNPKPHLFDYVPLVKIENNNLRYGDFKKVEELINAYDKTMSDAQNEIEEFRLAYLAFYGVSPTPEIIKAARQTGALEFPMIGEGRYADGKFLTKDINDQFIENHKKTLNTNIYRFSKSVDMSDENFSGSAQTGESRKWKLVGLENKAITKEVKFTKAAREMFKIIGSIWKKRNIPFNYEDLTLQFTRNLPKDVLYEAQIQGNLLGKVSDKTRLSLASFIPDPEKELEQMKQEAEEKGPALDDTNDEENPDGQGGNA